MPLLLKKNRKKKQDNIKMDPQNEAEVIEENANPIEETSAKNDVNDITATEQVVDENTDINYEKPRKRKREKVESNKKPVKEKPVKRTKTPNTKAIEQETAAFFTQDWIPVESIEYGMIKLKKQYGGHYVKIVEVEPTNFMLYNEEEKQSVLTEMAQWLTIAPVNVQFHLATVKSDVNELIHYILKQTENETNKKVLRRRDQYIRKIKELSVSEALAKRFYVIFKYEGGKNGMSNNIEDIVSTMYETLSFIKYYFNRMGNTVVEHEDESYFYASLLYREFNPYTSTKELFEDRCLRIIRDHAAYNLSIGNGEYSTDDIPFADYIAPKGIDTSNRNYIVYDGMYATFLYVRGSGYRQLVTAGWMENFTNFGEGVDITVYIHRQSREKAEEDSRRVSINKDVDAKTETRIDKIGEASNSATNADYVHRMIADEDEDLFDVFTLISIRSRSINELEKKKHSIKTLLRSKGYRVDECYQHNEAAFRMSLPLLIKDEQLFEKGSRNFLTSSLASMYFFTAFELNDRFGFLLGINSVNSSLAILNFFNTTKYKNANAVICGTSGMGKTYLLQQLGYAMRCTGISVSYILPYKGYEYKAACKAIGGEFVSLAPGAKTCINIMAIRPQKEVDKSYLEEDDDEPLLQKKIHQIITFVQLLKPKEEMTDSEETQLNIVLSKIYRDLGITEDNESIWEDKNKRLIKKMPIIGDLYDACIQDDILQKRVAIALRPFIEGSCTNMNGQTNVNLDNKYIVYDVSHAGKQMLPAFAFIATDCAYDAAKGDKTENCAIIMDEVWKMMVNLYCAEFVMEMYKIIRGYGGSAICATQDISDFLSFDGGTYGKKIISTSRIKFCLGAEVEELQDLSEHLGISDDEVRSLSKYDRGQVLMIANGEKVPINVKGTDIETYIFTTDAKTRRKLRERIKEDPSFLADLQDIEDEGVA